MKTMIAVVMVGACVLGVQQMDRPSMMNEATTETYRHLATAIIEIRATEDNLVKGILMHHVAMARRHLRMAGEASGTDRVSHLEQAAEEITNIANEGDKPVQAIRQRLLKAGHHHHTDAETQEDYIWVDSGEKKELLALARRVSGFGANASETDIRGALRDLNSLFGRVTAPE